MTSNHHSFSWTSKNTTQNGVEDLVLLSKVTDETITENLKKRILNDLMFTYVGPALVAVNPYKKMTYFTEREIDMYHGSAAYEHPPHIYAVAETMFQHLISDGEDQCVIISGESGAGKTESAKLFMNYISSVSGKGTGEASNLVHAIKHIILESNPLLESFGNAKTARNNNSSRFGKYFEIRFSKEGSPMGGKISNFLLEKSRIIGPGIGERNYHIFYQITKGCSPAEKEQWGLTDPSYFRYLSCSKEYSADGIDDFSNYSSMRSAMDTCQFTPEQQACILEIVAATLHLGNITFLEDGNNATMADSRQLAFPAFLLGVSESSLEAALLSRVMTTGGGLGKRSSMYTVPLNVQQASGSRDALAKTLYYRMFDCIVMAINNALDSISSVFKRTGSILSLGVLDIFGFEIFDSNGFQQFSINYINEKLQQIFIELTLKQEQEEYAREGIQWTPIEYFNNKVVVDLIESKRPPGVMSILDDVCNTMHAVTEGADATFVGKLATACSGNPHFIHMQSQFAIRHYAGTVTYDIEGFTESNKDTLFKDLILLMQSSSKPFIRDLFPETFDESDKKRPTTVSFKIRNQAQDLVGTLMKCAPSYIRCIKPNETKKPRDWDAKRVDHQVKYLNLKENVKVRRAGFCYRNTFDKFLRRFAIICKETFPSWNGPPIDGVQRIMHAVKIDSNEWQIGATKVFIKSPESLFLLEESRDRKYHYYACVIQRAYRSWKARQFFIELRKSSVDLLYGKKERTRFSMTREFTGDYLNFLGNPVLRSLVKSDTIIFAAPVMKYDRSFKPKNMELLLGNGGVYLIAEERAKEGVHKGKMIKVIKRHLKFNQISAVSVSALADNYLVLHVDKDFDSVLETVFKTELITLLLQKVQESGRLFQNVTISNSISYEVKKTMWQAGGSCQITFEPGSKLTVTNSGKTTKITVVPGLPSSSRPRIKEPTTFPQVVRATQVRDAPKIPDNAHLVQAPMYSAPSLRAVPKIPSEPSQMNASQASEIPPPIVRTYNASAKSSAAHSRNPSNTDQSHVYPRNVPILVPSSQAIESVSAKVDSHGVSSNQKGYPPSSVGSVGSTASSPSSLGQGPKKRPPLPPPKKLPKCRALYDYDPKEADELSFKEGEIITITKKDESGWWTGSIGPRKGVFPGKMHVHNDTTRVRDFTNSIVIQELQTNKKMCYELRHLSVLYRKHSRIRDADDIINLRTKTLKLIAKNETEKLSVQMNMSIIHPESRHTRLGLENKLHATEEKDVTNSIQSHREEINHFVWKRRVQMRNELQALFQLGPGSVFRYGDLLSAGTLDTLQSMEKMTRSILCKNLMDWGILEEDEDISSYYLRKAFLQSPKVKTSIVLDKNRLGFSYVEFADADHLSEKKWLCVYATYGPWKARYSNKTTAREVAQQMYFKILAQKDTNDAQSFAQAIAKLMDSVHPSHVLLANTMAFPQIASTFIKKRLICLGYHGINIDSDDYIRSGYLSHTNAVEIAKAVYLRAERETRCYFEFTVPAEHASWRVGFLVTSQAMEYDAAYAPENDHHRYPGMDGFSMGFDSEGKVWFMSKCLDYVQPIQLFPDSGFPKLRTVGILVDFAIGTISLVAGGKIMPVAFGEGASHFDEETRQQQKVTITTCELKPTFALLTQHETKLAKLAHDLESKHSTHTSETHIRVNFSGKFTHKVNSISLDDSLAHQSPKHLDQITVLDSTANAAEKTEDMEENSNSERLFFKTSVIPEVPKGFSRFPPNSYKRTIAAVSIQRCWRRFKGREMRKAIRKEQHWAAVIIQRAARAKLQQVHAEKNRAASIIQKAWRHKNFIWIALLRCIYKRPVSELHHAAKLIQHKWKTWHLYKNNPIAIKYKTSFVVLVRAIGIIEKWWKPTYARLSWIKLNRKMVMAALDIQRVFRGYKLRSKLRPEIRERLTAIGAVVAKNRRFLLMIRAALVIQRIRRDTIQRRIKLDHKKNRHRAASRIQALWRGYWTRLHTAVYFSYGELVFLRAITKALQNCHFIPKMYKPCGIVCPKRDNRNRPTGSVVKRWDSFEASLG